MLEKKVFAYQVLAQENTSRDTRAEQVGPLEAVPETQLLGVAESLHLDGGDDACQPAGDVVVFSVELLECLGGLLELVLPGKIPRRLGGKRKERQQEHGKEQLGGEGSAVSPAIGAFAKGLDYGVGEQLTQGDSQVYTSGGEATEGNGSKLTAGKRREGQVEAETGAEDELRAEEGRAGVGEHLADAAARADDDADEKRVLAADLVGEVAAEEAAEELADSGDCVEGGLPFGREDRFAVLDVSVGGF